VELDIIVLRLLHIISGVFWVGSAWLFFFFIEPTVTELGPDAEKFMTGLIVKRKMPRAITIAGAITVLAGLALIWRVSGGLTGAWFSTGPGIGFSIGGLAAIIAYAAGAAIIPRTLARVGALGAEMKAGGGPPSQVQIDEMGALQARLHQVGLIDAILFTVAVGLMAISRYL
jgi:hypothetical protein